MTLTEKVAYLKGLAEGLALDESKPETKVINAMLDVLDDLALTVADLEDGLDLMSEQLDAVDEDLDELENFVYEVKSRFAARVERRKLHPAHAPSMVETGKGILKELLRGLPNKNNS